MSTTVNLDKVNGRSVIGTSDLVYCNTKYHSPYLAVIGNDGEPQWQEKEYVGYGKHKEVYYVVEDLKPGDLIKAAGGSGGNKYPFHGIVVELNLEADKLVVDEISQKDMGNLLAKRKTQAAEKPKENPLATFTDEQILAEVKRRGLGGSNES